MRAAILLALLLLGAPAGAEPLAAGGDVLVGGADAIPASGRDLLAAGPSLTVTEATAEDAHLAGLSVTVEGATGGDLYAAGGSVSLRAPVGGDLTAMGFSLAVDPEATVAGNARLAGGSVALRGPVEGALLATGGSVTLDAAVAGDAWITAETVTFGPAARVGGTLHLATPEPVAVPEAVAAADRVEARRIEPGEAPTALPPWAPEWRRGWDRMEGWPRPGAGAISGAAVVVVAFLLALGAILLATVPARAEALRARVARRPGASLLWGVLGLSALLGLVPVSAATIVGLPLVPVVLLVIVAAWTLGYLLGVYAVATGLLRAVLPDPAERGTGLRLLALGLGLAVAALLNFVPVLGWIANLALMLLGLGALAAALAQRMLPAPPPLPAAPPPSPPPA